MHEKLHLRTLHHKICASMSSLHVMQRHLWTVRFHVLPQSVHPRHAPYMRNVHVSLLVFGSCCSMCRPVCCSMGACFETGEDDDPLQRSLAARCISERFQVIYSLLSHTDRQLDRYTHTHSQQARNTQTDIQTGLNTSRLPSTEDIRTL